MCIRDSAYPALINRLVLVGTGPRGGAGIDAVTGTTFGYMARAAREKISPKRYIFYTHDAQGGIEAQRVLDRMGARTEAHRGAPMKAVDVYKRQNFHRPHSCNSN